MLPSKLTHTSMSHTAAFTHSTAPVSFQTQQPSQVLVASLTSRS